ncbi:MAG TPA: hypothetical protein VMV69_27855 [Pirellulales bacterium]|nr:hypothetical protein [Pirellulales bacterium]
MHNEVQRVNAPIEPLGAPYYREARETLDLREWRDVVETACREAEFGDDRARGWIQRLLGVAEVARADAALNVLFGKMSHLRILREVQAARDAAFHGHDPIAPGSAHPTAPAPAPDATYWSVALEVVTAARWRAIVEIARDQALSGDPRAREFLSRVLGADDAIRALATGAG